MVLLEQKMVEGNVKKTECNALTVHTNSRTQPQSPSLTHLQIYKIAPHLLCGLGRGELWR